MISRDRRSVLSRADPRCVGRRRRDYRLALPSAAQLSKRLWRQLRARVGSVAGIRGNQYISDESGRRPSRVDVHVSGRAAAVPDAADLPPSAGLDQSNLGAVLEEIVGRRRQYHGAISRDRWSVLSRADPRCVGRRRRDGRLALPSAAQLSKRLWRQLRARVGSVAGIRGKQHISNESGRRPSRVDVHVCCGAGTAVARAIRARRRDNDRDDEEGQDRGHRSDSARRPRGSGVPGQPAL